MRYCTRCGKQIVYESEICDDCTSHPTLKSPIVFDEVAQQREFAPFKTTPLDQEQIPHPIQQFTSPQNFQTLSRCPYCSGAAGVVPKSTISTGGFVYMGIMFTITFITFLIFFPCALIPFGLLFFGLLFKEKHFACINCGQKLN